VDNTIITPADSRRARTELGLTQRKLAERSGLSRSKLSWLEGGQFTPDERFLTELRKFYESEGVELGSEPAADRGARGDREKAGKAREAVPPVQTPPGNDQPEAGDDGDDGDELAAKRRQRSRDGAADARGKARGRGLPVSEEISDEHVQSIMEKIAENDERIEQLTAEKTGDGVRRGGGWFFGDDDDALQLAGEDEEIHDELVQRMAANYVLMRLLQGRAVVAPCGDDETVRKPEKAGDHGELLAALVHPFVCGPVPESPDAKETATERKAREEGEGRRGLLAAVK